MSADRFRFIHATNLRLDQPLTGAGALSSDHRAKVEDATLTAFTRIVDACLQHDVHCLLLTGDCFEHQSGTLRGRLQMQRGLERLDEKNISVFIITGSLDPPSSWKRGISLPANTTLFTSDDDDPVDVMDGDDVIASIAPVATAHSDEASWNARGPAVWRSEANVFRIGLVGAGSAITWNGATPEHSGGPGTSHAAATLVRAAIEQGVNYIALGEGAERATIDILSGVAHDPGSPQGLNPQESGAKGCSLVDCHASGEIDIKFLPTASVRWMSFAADAPTHVDLDQLAERMALMAMESEPYATDDLWLIRWFIRGTNAEWTKTLGDLRTQEKLWELVERELASVGGPSRRHTFDTHARRGLVERQTPLDPGSSKLWGEFCEQIDAHAKEAFEGFQKELSGADWAQSGWARHVRTAMQRSSPATISRRSRELGQTWLE